mgnify:CR=1 FL=1
MKDTKKRLKFEEGLKTIVGGFCWSQDGGDGGYDFGDIVKYIDKATQEARAEERARVVGVIEVSLMGQNVIFNLVGRGKLEEAQKCNQANHILRTLLASLDKSVTKKE